MKSQSPIVYAFIDGQNLNLGAGEITASNVIYSLTPGDGIDITGGQTPTITNTGVLSVGGQTGAIEFEPGAGIQVDGLTITNVGVLSVGGLTGDVALTAGTGIQINGGTIENVDLGSAQTIFKTFNVDGTPIVASSNTDILNFATGPGVNLTVDTNTKTITFDSLPAENENDIEAYIFDDDNDQGTMTSGTIDLDQVTFVGTLGLANGGLNQDLSSATNGQLLIGNGAGFTLSTITQGAGITLTNGAGSITIANQLGNTIDTTEIVNQTIRPDDLNVVAVPLDGQLMTYDSSTGLFEWQDVGGIVPGDISAVGDVLNGPAFTETNTYDGNSLFFDGPIAGNLDYEIELTAEDATNDQILTLPNKTGTIATLDDIHDPISIVTNGHNYISLNDQQIVLNQVDLTNDVVNELPVTYGGTGAITAGGARVNLGLEIVFGGRCLEPLCRAGKPVGSVGLGKKTSGRVGRKNFPLTKNTFFGVLYRKKSFLGAKKNLPDPTPLPACPGGIFNLAFFGHFGVKKSRFSKNPQKCVRYQGEV